MKQLNNNEIILKRKKEEMCKLIKKLFEIIETIDEAINSNQDEQLENKLLETIETSINVELEKIKNT